MKILIDNGHGLNILGKRSPDGTLIEAAYTREIGRIVSYLTDRGYDAELLVPEDEDISLSERVKRVNAISSSCPAPTEHLAPNVILISIHINAAGNGSKWTNATGWSVYTCKGQTASAKQQ
jgi:N-acetylmuramoyl-L-alanine amidase